ncbi:MAG: Na+/H+ antiporter NhaA, partial [Gemmatimonadaceae bacterium]
GELATARKAALPVAAALGGMIVPALFYFAFNAHGAGKSGWGVPMATDIAFALGVLALIGDRIPASLRVFLSALAITDDLGAVLVIALFYTSAISWAALGAAAALLVLSIIANRTGVRAVWAYVVIGIALWIAMLLSGVDATVAGVLLAFTIPARPREGETESLVERFERDLRVPVTFGVLPLFALANAGVSFIGSGDILLTPVALGVIAGLFLGKPIGISLAIYSTVRIGITSIPDDVTRRMLFGAAVLGGIGFTMSLFISGLAFGQSPEMLTSAKLGTFAASVLAGIAGWLVLRGAPRVAGDSDLLVGPPASRSDGPTSLL